MRSSPDLSHLKALGRPEGTLPTDVRSFFLTPIISLLNVLQIVIEALIGLALSIVGACLYVNASTPLKEITWASEMRKRCLKFTFQRLRINGCYRSIDDMDSRLGFASFVNRGRHFFSSDVK